MENENVQGYQDTSFKQEKQSWFKTTWLRFKEFIVECKRVLIVTKKPTNEEFKTIFKVAGLGILIIGAIGFIIQLFEILIK